jgi:hypothetical protein
MGFLSRSVSLIRYRVRGDVEGSFWDSVHEGISKGIFREGEFSGDDLTVGWVSMEDFTDTSFAGSSYLRGNYVALGLRVDTLRVPPRIVELHVKKESRKLIEQTGQARLSSSQFRELRERVRETLRRQILPSVQVFDLVWDTSRGIAYFGSHSPKARDRVETHFKKCFGLTLLPLIPYLCAEELLGESQEKQVLEQVRPSSLVV